MPKHDTDKIEFKGKVVEAMPNSTFKVELENGHRVVCYASGRIKTNMIRITIGDEVTIEVSAYDIDKGRIIYRH